jgi:hypothetical protein
MKNIYKLLTINLVVASITAFVPAQPASAQLLELATGALSILNSVTGNSNSQPTPQPVAPVIIPQQSTAPAPPLTPNIKAGAGNFNGNTLNLCISGCLPNGTQTLSPGVAPVNPFPAPSIPQPVPQTIPPGVNSVNTVPAPTIAQPVPQTMPPGVNSVNTVPSPSIPQPVPQATPPGINPVNTQPSAPIQPPSTPIPSQSVPNQPNPLW